MAEKETLVVASKVKAYIKTTADMKCSAAVIDVLSDKIREMTITRKHSNEILFWTEQIQILKEKLWGYLSARPGYCW